VAAILGVVAATGLWWMYFDNLEGSVVRRKVEDAKAWRPTTWIYGHLPLAAALVATGVGLEHAVVESVEHDTFPLAERWLLVTAVAAVFAAMALIQFATVLPEGRRTNRTIMRNRLIGVPVVLAVGFLGFLSALWIVFLVVLICAAEVAADVYSTTRSEVRTALTEGREITSDDEG
jgi:low temperature requirement protein LtrA